MPARQTRSRSTKSTPKAKAEPKAPAKEQEAKAEAATPKYSPSEAEAEALRSVTSVTKLPEAENFADLVGQLGLQIVNVQEALADANASNRIYAPKFARPVHVSTYISQNAVLRGHGKVVVMSDGKCSEQTAFVEEAIIPKGEAVGTNVQNGAICARDIHHMVWYSREVRFGGFRVYKGDIRDILEQNINALMNWEVELEDRTLTILSTGA